VKRTPVVHGGLNFDVGRYFEGSQFKEKAVFRIADSFRLSSSKHHINM
jgi:hypothetical protein